MASIVPTAGASGMPSANTARCVAVANPYPRPRYAFRAVSIPEGADACHPVGTYGDPLPFYLTNYGSLVAFGGRDAAHQGDVWFGDLAAGTVKLAYEAPAQPSQKAEIWYLQMVSDSLVWLERLHEGATVSAPLKEWSIKRLGLQTGEVTTLLSSPGLPFGGTKIVEPMRYDGRRLALGEGVDVDTQRWQIEVVDLADMSSSIVPVERTLYDVALVDDGVIFTTGVNNAEHGSIGQMKMFHWTKARGVEEVGAANFHIVADGRLMAWVQDKLGSELSTGKPATPQMQAAILPSFDPIPLSRLPYGQPTVGINYLTAGSGTVAWWEDEYSEGGGQLTLTLWQPGWKEPIQVETPGNNPFVSVNGGWLVWFEYDQDSIGRLRGVPLSTLIAAVGPLT